MVQAVPLAPCACGGSHVARLLTRSFALKLLFYSLQFPVRRDTDLRHVMSTLLSNKVHRAWVVDPTKGSEEGPMLVGVVSMTDILRMMRCLPVIDPSCVVPEEAMQDAEEEFKDWDMDSLLWLDWWPAALGLGPDYVAR